MLKIIYLSTTQVLAIHDQMIKRFGGSSGIRDLTLLESAVARPQATFGQKDLYNELFEKAAALMESLLKNHPFVDGNKRTALTATGIFLQMNGYRLRNYHEDEIAFALEVANQRLGIEKITRWLKEHSESI